ncbi:biotin-dependent carboxyltransferase family protein [Aliiroseovarius sp. KMU-50]|uniref:Biotin-dependent carboxyltransferase family protein n=1 Tax=Aliiroseovarius salicola TaxID=3009082 RepID=A0ABT4W0U0_9RHOB|nr:biotin-dependent carboxyltransferase family protein [Aliiroseovarius sp. KMU-50]MDA5094123.1 biotin-dependent carboxyltransferase family protein [Aliiroseovarius sp. KMU-50]
MADARFRVQFAGPLVTYQDAGRRGLMRFGVPASGPMDRLSYAAANAALGQPTDATTIEISMGGLLLECLEGEVSIALTGGEFNLTLDGTTQPGWTICTVSAGQKLSIRPGPSGSWAYLAFAGNLVTDQWLGHSATHSTSGFGGGALASGQDIVVRESKVREEREGPIQRPDFLPAPGAPRVVMGPQNHHFSSASQELFQMSTYALSDAFDRMGVRLEGPKLDLEGALSIPSEPVCKGSIQVAGDGVPTVLLADHQTTGGYPKIATVISADLDQFAQMRARDSLAFTLISPDEAVSIARNRAAAVERYLEAISQARGTLPQRLMRENLISGVVS